MRKCSASLPCGHALAPKRNVSALKSCCVIPAAKDFYDGPLLPHLSRESLVMPLVGLIRHCTISSGVYKRSPGMFTSGRVSQSIDAWLAVPQAALLRWSSAAPAVAVWSLALVLRCSISPDVEFGGERIRR